jgi:hypothetical protein
MQLLSWSDRPPTQKTNCRTQALAAQAALLSDVSPAVEAAPVADELRPPPGTVLMQLTAAERAKLAVEYPTGLLSPPPPPQAAQQPPLQPPPQPQRAAADGPASTGGGGAAAAATAPGATAGAVSQSPAAAAAAAPPSPAPPVPPGAAALAGPASSQPW